MSITPGKLGEILKSYFLKQLNHTPLSKSMPIVMAERFTDFIAMIILALAGISTLNYGRGVFIISIAIILLFLIIIRFKNIFMAFITFSAKIPLVSSLTSRFEIFYQSTYELMGFRNLSRAIFIGIIAWFFECYGFYLVFKSFDIEFSLFNATFIYAFSTIAGAMTMLPGGIGATEGSITAMLILFNIPKSFSVASTIIIRICTLWFGVLLGVVALFLTLKRFEIAESLGKETKIVAGG